MKPRAADGTTLQIRVLRVLREIGSFDADRIGELVGVERGAAHTACRYLAARGFVEKRKMAAKWVIYRALPRKREPADLRGKPAGCRNQCYANVLAMLRAKCGPHWRPKARAIALEAAWPPLRESPASKSAVSEEKPQ